MIIEVLIFFSFIILFLVVGALVALSARRRRSNIARTPEEARTVGEFGFLRRNWFLVVLIILILNPLTIHWMRAAAHKKNYKEQLRRPDNAGGGDTGSRDTTSYHVVTAPNH